MLKLGLLLTTNLRKNGEHRSPKCTNGGIGRRAGLRIQCPRREGSSPFWCTKKGEGVSLSFVYAVYKYFFVGKIGIYYSDRPKY